MVVLHFTLFVEAHGGNLVRGEDGPGWKPTVVGITIAREMDPGIADFGGEFPRLGRAAGRKGGQIGVVEHIGDLAKVVGARPPVENRRMVTEQV